MSGFDRLMLDNSEQMMLLVDSGSLMKTRQRIPWTKTENTHAMIFTLRP